MKKYISFLLLAVLSFSAISVQAEESTRGQIKNTTRVATEERTQLRDELKNKRETFVKELKTKKEEFRKATKETKQKFWDGSKRMIGERFDAAMKNMARMQNRVEEIIQNAKDAGKDVVKAESYLESSKTKLSEAQKKIEQIKTLIPAKSEEITADTFEKIKTLARESKDLLKEAHEALVNAITELKGVLGEEDKQSDDTSN